MTTDHATIAQEHVDKASRVRSGDHIDSAHRAHMVDYHLRLAQIHATLAVAQQINLLPLPALA